MIPLLTVIAFSVPLITYASDSETSAGSACGFSANIQFMESAPRDRFTLHNTSNDGHISHVVLDLSTAAGNLVFDITAAGAGVEVFQPYRSENSEAVLSTQPVVDDGDQIIELTFSSFNPGDKHQFSIDIDDQLSDSELGQIRVSGGEIAGATITIEYANGKAENHSVSAFFDSTNQAMLDGGSC